MQKRELRGEGGKGPISEDKLSLPPRLAPRSRSLNELSSHPVIPFLTRREESVLGPTSHRPAPGIGSRAPRRRTCPRPVPQIILTRIPGLLSPPLHGLNGLNEAHGAARRIPTAPAHCAQAEAPPARAARSHLCLINGMLMQLAAATAAKGTNRPRSGETRCVRGERTFQKR